MANLLEIVELESDEERRLSMITQHQDVNILKAARVGKGFTQQQVANTAKINIRHYQRFESGERNIKTASFYVTMAVCKALEIMPENILEH